MLGKRGGRILHGDLQEGSANFEVTALLPVVESFDFANEVRRQTSGLALPQLVFCGWEVSKKLTSKNKTLFERIFVCQKSSILDVVQQCLFNSAIKKVNFSSYIFFELDFTQ